MNKKFRKPYNHKKTEEKIYKEWENSGYFNPDNLPKRHREAFTIVLPPPNVTGILHLGHAYEDSIQDAIIRYQRMKGKKALWIPGTDSAAIATQAKVEKKIKKEEKKSRHDLGRKELIKRISKFAKNSENTILKQIKRMGASLDWDRYAYTLDKKRSKAVAFAFKKMYEAGLIYRGDRIVNWDAKGQTTISDDEIIYKERDSKLYTFKYSKDFPIAISTTRPETKVGDVAVAVHPDDKRYAKYINKKFTINFCEVQIHIKIIADKSVEKEIGTGALGVTPAHSQIDWEIAERHNLPKKQVINEYAKMMTVGILKDKKVEEAREIVITWLEKNNLLEKTEHIKQNVPTSERTNAIIEPLPKLQWWVNVNKTFKIKYSEIPGIKSNTKTSLKDIMKKSVTSKAIKIPQKNYQKIYFHWLDNLKDWCISRQIWFGHRIPVWYKNGEIYCGFKKPKGNQWKQEEDVLDTWFSSALWTFSTLNWPEKKLDLKKYHPTSLISPAYEILPLWISRMILMSGFHLGQIPFKEVMIHGLVKDKSGRKFSKSLGNGIDPIEIIDKYGADSLRMGLLIGTSIGNDIKFDENKIKGYKYFTNKLWNITRFILENTADIKLNKKDKKILEEFNKKRESITNDFEKYKLHLAAEKIYHYIWHRLADQIIEKSKPILNSDKEKEKISRQYLLLQILRDLIIILHPLMPFVTEEIWKNIRNDNDNKLLMITEWP